VKAANHNFMNYGDIHLAHLTVAHLLRAGAAKIDQQLLISV
jgi:aspartate 1-decarboxylase